MLAWVVIDRRQLRHRTPIPSSLLTPRLCVKFSDSFLDHFHLSSIFRTFFQVVYPATPLFATSYENCQGVGTFFPFWKSLARHDDENSIFIQVLSFRILAHSFVLSKKSTLLFSVSSGLFAAKHPGWGMEARFAIRWKTEVRYPSIQSAQGGLQIQK